ncbi:MAG: KH domain-containing protein [Clostridiales bacterium]|nr:KH domain-containing protein [Clostridiales bacterium]
MLKYMEFTAKTEDEAIAKGLAYLGLDRDDVSVEILERGKTGFLGIGSVPAKVKLTYEAPDEPEPIPEPPVVKEPKPAPAPKAEKPNPPKGERPAPKPQPKPEHKPAPAAQSKTAQSQAAAPKGEPVDDDVAAAIVKFQTGLFAHMGVEAVPVVTREGDTYQVVLEGEDMGALIGHRGETLDAIQQLTGYAVNRGRSHRVRIHVDAEGYRARREESLNRLARKTAGKVVKYRRNITLEAMNAYERHVIHTALQDYPGVTTFSTGTEPNRRTVVAYDPSK